MHPTWFETERAGCVDDQAVRWRSPLYRQCTHVPEIGNLKYVKDPIRMQKHKPAYYMDQGYYCKREKVILFNMRGCSRRHLDPPKLCPCQPCPMSILTSFEAIKKLGKDLGEMNLRIVRVETGWLVVQTICPFFILYSLGPPSRNFSMNSHSSGQHGIQSPVNGVHQ